MKAACYAIAGLLMATAACVPSPVVVLATPPLVDADTLVARPFGPEFRDARAIARDPAGILYVSDGHSDLVHILSPNGDVVSRLGGPGSGDYAFLGPRGIDPTNGLILYVADGGNGRIQRFTHEGRFIETVVVPAEPEAFLGRRVDEVERGRPLAVAAASSGELYVAEALRGVVLLWDDRRTLERIIGTAGDGRGALRRPVALALAADGRLLVADAGQNAVLVYDAFGSFLRRLADGTATDVRDIVADRDHVAIILADRVLVYDPDGLLMRTLVVDIPEPIVGGALAHGELVVVTRTRLWRVR
jgi:DNA-binding beta-propeller fold protein YncE